jgi:hypothetical protein
MQTFKARQPESNILFDGQSPMLQPTTIYIKQESTPRLVCLTSR